MQPYLSHFSIFTVITTCKYYLKRAENLYINISTIFQKKRVISKRLDKKNIDLTNLEENLFKEKHKKQTFYYYAIIQDAQIPNWCKRDIKIKINYVYTRCPQKEDIF